MPDMNTKDMFQLEGRLDHDHDVQSALVQIIQMEELTRWDDYM